DLVRLLYLGEDGQGAVGVGEAGFPVSLDAGLREDHEERKLLLASLELDGVADALLDGQLAIVAALPGAVQEQDQRIRLVAGVVMRDEEDVLAVAVGPFVDAGQEAGPGVAGKRGQGRWANADDHANKHQSQTVHEAVLSTSCGTLS